MQRPPSPAAAAVQPRALFFLTGQVESGQGWTGRGGREACVSAGKLMPVGLVKENTGVKKVSECGASEGEGAEGVPRVRRLQPSCLCLRIALSSQVLWHGASRPSHTLGPLADSPMPP